MDAYYRANPPVVVVKDKDALITRRPLKYIQQEEDDIRRERGSPTNSVVEATALEEKSPL